MNNALTPEQLEYQSVIGQFLTKEWPDGAVHQAVGGSDRQDKLWKRLTGELDITGVLIPEEYGGLGLSQVEMSLVAEELGRVLYTGPWFATAALAVNALLVAQEPQAWRTHLPAIAAGTRTATLAYEDHRLRGATPEPTRAEQSDDGQWTLTGTKDHVVHGADVDLLLVTAQTPEGLTLFAVDNSTGLTVSRLDPLDPTRPLARLEFRNTPATPVSGVGSFDLAHTLDLASISATAEAVGGAAACVQLTVAYVKTRTQFGKAIGSFQAVKHRLADMRVRLETARSALRYLARAVDSEPENLPLVVAVAKSHATQAYFRTAADSIQLHGGIGFTWEHISHFHFKRAKAGELMLGTHQELRRRIATALFDEPAR